MFYIEYRYKYDLPRIIAKRAMQRNRYVVAFCTYVRMYIHRVREVSRNIPVRYHLNLSMVIQNRSRLIENTDSNFSCFSLFSRCSFVRSNEFVPRVAIRARGIGSLERARTHKKGRQWTVSKRSRRATLFLSTSVIHIAIFHVPCAPSRHSSLHRVSPPFRTFIRSLPPPASLLSDTPRDRWTDGVVLSI